MRSLAIPLDAQKDTPGQAATLKTSCSKGLQKGLKPNLPAPSRSHSFFAVSVPCLRKRSRKAAATLELLVAARALLGTAEAAWLKASASPVELFEGDPFLVNPGISQWSPYLGKEIPFSVKKAESPSACISLLLILKLTAVSGSKQSSRT